MATAFLLSATSTLLHAYVLWRLRLWSVQDYHVQRVSVEERRGWHTGQVNLEWERAPALLPFFYFPLLECFRCMTVVFWSILIFQEINYFLNTLTRYLDWEENILGEKFFTAAVGPLSVYSFRCWNFWYAFEQAFRCPLPTFWCEYD